MTETSLCGEYLAEYCRTATLPKHMLLSNVSRGSCIMRRRDRPGKRVSISHVKNLSVTQESARFYRTSTTVPTLIKASLLRAGHSHTCSHRLPFTDRHFSQVCSAYVRIQTKIIFHSQLSSMRDQIPSPCPSVYLSPKAANSGPHYIHI